MSISGMIMKMERGQKMQNFEEPKSVMQHLRF